MRTARRTGGWLGAAIVVLGAHLGAAGALLGRPPPPPVPPAPAVVELVAAPAPTPGFAVPESPLPRLDGQVHLQPPAAEPPDLALPPLARLEPPVFPEVSPPPEPDPVEPARAEPIVAPAPEAAPTAPPVPSEVAVSAVRPRMRPANLQRPEEAARETARKREAARKTPRKAERAAEQPERRAEPAARSDAPRQAASAEARRGGGEARSAAPASARPVQSWESRVRQATARHMNRARVSARGQLSVTLAVRIDGSGRIAGVSLSRGSGDAGVDAALMRHARRLPRLPAPPNGTPRNVIVPFRIVR